MKRKKYIKLLMGMSNIDRNKAKVLASLDVVIFGSYDEAYFIQYSGLSKSLRRLLLNNTHISMIGNLY